MSNALTWHPFTQRPDLVADVVREALTGTPLAVAVEVAAMDPDLADTQALVDASDVLLAECANCLVVLGRRGEIERVAAALVLATTRADVNTVVRKSLDVRKASFLPMDRAVSETGMEFGGITPIGLPGAWPVLVDSAVIQAPQVVIGAGVRGAKLRLPGALIVDLPGVQVVEGLAR